MFPQLKHIKLRIDVLCPAHVYILLVPIMRPLSAGAQRSLSIGGALHSDSSCTIFERSGAATITLRRQRVLGEHISPSHALIYIHLYRPPPRPVVH